ncbi:HD domain-containing protein [Methanospirillum hungatei]|uniref:HD domain-containing protein n=1 Tax=Methanospirillum hungatei TaxID=2203 RepID=UPI0026EDB203|nr:HD domain-containing protein [Methanospirillum hungatei]MCA1916906.1 HD domain-containing protein [Methanospirillum hungatei]
MNQTARSCTKITEDNTNAPSPYLSPYKDHILKPDVRHSAGKRIEDHISPYPKTSLAWELLTKVSHISVLWDMAAFTTTERLRMNDHGRTHAQVTAASALTILDLLCSSDIKPDIIKKGGDLDDATLIVLVSALCHDIGNAIHRDSHLSHSMMLAQPILDMILPVIYPDPKTALLIRAFILSAIHSHHGDPKPLTIEGSIISVADASDMTKGRACHSTDISTASMHAISTLAIDDVIITRGLNRPVEIQIVMSQLAGMFQIHETLIPKIHAGLLKDHVNVYIPLQDQYIY